MAGFDLFVDAIHYWLVYIMMPILDFVSLNAHLSGLFATQLDGIGDGQSILQASWFDLPRDRLRPLDVRCCSRWGILSR